MPTSFHPALLDSQEEFELPDRLEARLRLKNRDYEARIQEFFHDFVRSEKASTHHFAAPETARRHNEARAHYIDARYKLEISNMLLRERAIEIGQTREAIQALEIPFEREIFRNAFGVIMDYCQGTIELPKPESRPSESASLQPTS